APAPGESGGADDVQELVGERTHGPQQAIAAQVVDGGLADAELGEFRDPVLDHRTPVVEGWRNRFCVKESGVGVAGLLRRRLPEPLRAAPARRAAACRGSAAPASSRGCAAGVPSPGVARSPRSGTARPPWSSCALP